MGTFNKFQDFSEQVAKGVHVFGTHSFKLALTNSAPVATNTVLANITQIANGNGYTTGGAAVPNLTCTESSGITTVAADQVVFTATGAMGTFRYLVLYNDTAASDNLVGWWDHGSTVSLQAGETYTFKFNDTATGGTILTLS